MFLSFDWIFTQKECKNETKKLMAKHRMFGAPNLHQSKKITQPLVVMVETFRMSDFTVSGPRHFKCHKMYIIMILGEQTCTPKSLWILSLTNLQQKKTAKMTNYTQYPK